ncbi:hypothetical protein Tco_0912996, partial [Tanacetum coccineum]
VFRPNNRQEHRSGNRKSLQQSSILKSLATWGKDDSITSLVNKYIRWFRAGVLWPGGGDFLEERVKATQLKQCLRTVADWYFTKAVKPSITFSEPSLVAEIDSVFDCIKLFLKDTSCKRDGLRAQHILDTLCREGSATATNLLKDLTHCSRHYMEMFGFQVSGGVEAVLHSVNIVLSGYHNDRSLAMLTMDFLNAFNLLYRSASLHEDTPITWSATEVSKIPIGPILFAFCIAPAST